jgi:hypothetical protein
LVRRQFALLGRQLSWQSLTMIAICFPSASPRGRAAVGRPAWPDPVPADTWPRQSEHQDGAVLALAA